MTLTPAQWTALGTAIDPRRDGYKRKDYEYKADGHTAIPNYDLVAAAETFYAMAEEGERVPGLTETSIEVLPRGDQWPGPGDKMMFLGKNGYDSQLDAAKKLFTIGEVYTVKDCEVHSWSHDIEFEEVAGRYNGVMFTRLAP